MRRFVTAFAIAGIPLLLPSCGSQGDRSKTAREAIAAVEAMRLQADEFHALVTRVQEIEEKGLKGSSPAERTALERELDSLKEKANTIKGQVQQMAGELEPDLTKRIERTPGDPGLLEARSMLRETLGGAAEALQDLDAARAILPRDAALKARRPGLLRRLGRYEEARAACADLLKEEASQPVAIATDGICLFALNAFPEAVARLEEAAAKEGRLSPSLAREVKITLEAARTKRVEWEEELKKRAAEAKADDLPRAKVVTARGDFVIELFENEAPNAVANFIDLCDRKFYDGTTFHQIYPDFLVHAGDPLSKDRNEKNDGGGGPGYTFKDELEPGYRRHFRGSVSMYNYGKDTNGSQFLLSHRPTGKLDGQYVVFGRVVEGMAVVDALQKGDELVRTEILRKRPHAYRPVVE